MDTVAVVRRPVDGIHFILHAEVFLCGSVAGARLWYCVSVYSVCLCVCMCVCVYYRWFCSVAYRSEAAACIRFNRLFLPLVRLLPRRHAALRI